MRRIVCAAIRLNGYVICGARHFDSVMLAQIKCRVDSDDWYSNDVTQGFIDNKGIYLDRYEALKVAQDANQLIRKTNPVDRLFSEDLY